MKRAPYGGAFQLEQHFEHVAVTIFGDTVSVCGAAASIVLGVNCGSFAASHKGLTFVDAGHDAPRDRGAEYGSILRKQSSSAHLPSLRGD